MTNILLTYIKYNNIFRRRSDLTYHIKRHHQSSIKIKFDNGHVMKVKKREDDIFKCKCGKSFKASTSLRKHMKRCKNKSADVEQDEIEIKLMNIDDSDASESMNLNARIIVHDPIDCFDTLIVKNADCSERRTPENRIRHQ